MDLGACLLTLNEKTINQTILDGGGHALGITVGGGGACPTGLGSSLWRTLLH